MTVPTTPSTPLSRRDWLLSDRPQSRMRLFHAGGKEAEKQVL